jgi:hypothetical protein
MWQYIIKILITVAIVVAVAEVAKRNMLWAAALASLPLTSLLAFIWLHVDGVAPERIASLSVSILWLVLASLVLFVALPLLLRTGVTFWLSLALSCAATAIVYVGTVALLSKVGVRA